MKAMRIRHPVFTDDGSSMAYELRPVPGGGWQVTFDGNLLGEEVEPELCNAIASMLDDAADAARSVATEAWPRTEDNVPVDVFRATPLTSLWYAFGDCEIECGTVVGWRKGLGDDSQFCLLDGADDELWVDVCQCHSSREALVSALASYR